MLADCGGSARPILTSSAATSAAVTSAFQPPAFPCVKFSIMTPLLRLSNLVSGTCLITFPVEVPGDGSFRYSCV